MDNKTIAITSGNFTCFNGIADISTNGEIKWENIPVTVHLLNSNIISGQSSKSRLSFQSFANIWSYNVHDGSKR
jgi:hypothetical protein